MLFSLSVLHLMYLWPFSRSREANYGDWEWRSSTEREGKEDQETTDHLLEPTAAGAQPALSADPIPGAAWARRLGGKNGTNSNPGSVHIYLFTVIR